MYGIEDSTRTTSPLDQYSIVATRINPHPVPPRRLDPQELERKGSRQSTPRLRTPI